MATMTLDDFHDLGMCPDCGRDMDAGELHTAECAIALAQDAADGDREPVDEDEWLFVNNPELTKAQALRLLDALDSVPGRRPKWDR